MTNSLVLWPSIICYSNICNQLGLTFTNPKIVFAMLMLIAKFPLCIFTLLSRSCIWHYLPRLHLLLLLSFPVFIRIRFLSRLYNLFTCYKAFVLLEYFLKVTHDVFKSLFRRFPQISGDGGNDLPFFQFFYSSKHWCFAIVIFCHISFEWFCIWHCVSLFSIFFGY